MKNSFKKITFSLFLVFSFRVTVCETVEPKLTVIFVIDQFSHAYLDKLGAQLNGGLKFLLTNGVSYENAYHPHGAPATATGHAALNTGVFAKDHGVIGNKWFDGDGNKIYFANDSGGDCLVFDRNGAMLDFGKSPRMLMAQGLSDSFVLSPKSAQKNYVYTISLKDRAAIATAGRLGKAIWFEDKIGCFTSSKAYFKELPEWVKNFNANKKIYDIKTVKWEPVHPLGTLFYKFQDAFNYKFASGKSMIGTDVPICYGSKSKYERFDLTPHSSDIVFDLAQECVERVLGGDKNSRLILWVSISSLDKIGHAFGPWSAEAIDMVYHIDKKLGTFIKNLQKNVKQKETIFVLTADHGVCPIPELLQEHGVKTALRIDSKKLLQDLNSITSVKFGIQKICLEIENGQLFLRKKIFDNLSLVKKQEFIKCVKGFLKNIPGIKEVWTYNELQNKKFKSNSLESYYKNQLYEGRSGEFIIHVEPFCQITDYTSGTAHTTPYECDTHVPLIIYQKGILESKIIQDRVFTLQLANTLSCALKIPRVPASTFSVLPGLF